MTGSLFIDPIGRFRVLSTAGGLLAGVTLGWVPERSGPGLAASRSASR
jgi:hypothetical protein